MSKDYYDILGVTKNASDDEIKRSYRRLAAQYHPDKHGGDKSIEEKFKEINVAYTTLSDKEKRSMYDKYGKNWEQAAQQGGFDTSSFGFEDASSSFFSSIFGDGGFFNWNGTSETQGQDLSMEISISLEDAMKGIEKTVSFNKTKECSSCMGSGATGGNKGISVCKDCNGSGRLVRRAGPMVMESLCNKCQGQGKTIKHICNMCYGKGAVQGPETVAISVPAGIQDGQRIKLRNKGGFAGGEYGTLYIVVNIKPHSIFKQHGDTLTMELPITFVDAAMGCNKTITDIVNQQQCINIPAGTDSGSVISIRGAGATKLNGGRGNLKVHISVETPKNLSDKQKELLDLFSKEEQNNYPKTQGIWDKIKHWFL